MRPPLWHIDYGRTPLRSRRWLVWAILLLVLVIVGVLAVRHWVPAIKQYAKNAAAWHQAQQKCLKFTWPPGEVVFDEATPTAAVGLMDEATGRPVRWRSGRQQPAIVNPQTQPTGWLGGWHAQCWSELRWAAEPLGGPSMSAYSVGPPAVTYDPVAGSGYRSSIDPTGPSNFHDECRFLCFLHCRQSPGRPERLVAVSFDAGGFIWDDPNPFWACVMPVSLPNKYSWPSFARVPNFAFTCPPQDKLRLFAGQPDPADPSHFTIGYQAGDKKGVIDGWLKEDDTVVLKLRP